MVGTPYYLSPEICLGRPYSFKSDMLVRVMMMLKLQFVNVLLLETQKERERDVFLKKQRKEAKYKCATHAGGPLDASSTRS